MQWFTCAAMGAWLCLGCGAALAQQANYDEAKVPTYTLPDPLVAVDGTRITTIGQWQSKRRPEILKLFQTYEYGKAPGRPADMSFQVTDTDANALGGKATRKQVTIYFSKDKAGPQLSLLMYIPNGRKGPAPAFVGLNFGGNHTINDDPAIAVTKSWVRDAKNNHHATDASRGSAKSRWPVDMIVARGYALATAYYGDIDPDFDDGFKNGVHPLFDKPGQDPRPGDAWGSIGAWAWGLARIMDYFESDGDIDAAHVAVMGHSRLGKTSLWAGARDQRFALVISNCSGCGGAALSRRAFGETVQRINTSFPHWFCGNFKKFNGKEGDCPVDQHMLIALIAPRPVYVASAQEDQWADPHGEFLSCKFADPVYRLLGTAGLPGDKMPGVSQPVVGRIGYHIRPGKHDVTRYDWQQYLAFADKQFARK